MYYVVMCEDMVEGIYSEFEEALRRIHYCKGRSFTIIRGEVVVQLGEAELGVVSRLLKQLGSEEVVAEGAAVVFDQMFKGFAEVIDRELKMEGVELHEIIGRGLERPIRIGRVFKQPARDDYDVLKLLETLAKHKRKVVFFTGDKKLAQQASSLKGVIVEYLPPGEFTGKEAAIKTMVDKLKHILSGTR